MCVVAATMGNVGANLQALGAQTANDVVGVLRRRRVESPRVGQIAVGGLLLVSAVFAVSTAKTTSNLVELAMVSYAGIVQLAPTLFLGVFWRRGNAVAATASMIAGFATAAVLQWQYPDAVPGLEGLSGGMVGLIVNAAVYVACALLVPTREEERRRVDELFAAVREPRRESVPVSTLPDLEPAA